MKNEYKSQLDFDKNEFQRALLSWYHENKRSLPWRDDPRPYFVWISEIMLQQTRVEAVLGYFERFIGRLPSIKDLAEISDDELHKLWEGLGYYNRAKNLKKAAQLIRAEYGGELPPSYEELLKLPGIGEYTAGAIASIAFGLSTPAVDGNVLRVFSRIRQDSRDISLEATKKEVSAYVKALLPSDEAGHFNQALMELGALICLPNGRPKCEICPVKELCLAHREGDEMAYPVKKAPKKRRIEERTIVLIANKKGEFLIQKREEKGLLSGLWEFPSFGGHIDERAVKERLLEMGLNCSQLHRIEASKHIFSHIEWHMEGYLALLTEDDYPSLVSEDGLSYGGRSSTHQRQLWCSTEALRETYSIPGAFKVYMKSMEEGLAKSFLRRAQRSFSL